MHTGKILSNIQVISLVVLFIVSISCAQTWPEKNFALLSAAVGLSEEQRALYTAQIDKQDNGWHVSPSVYGEWGTCELFKQFPQLPFSIAYISLAELPTPIQDETLLGNQYHLAAFHIKRDDLTDIPNNKELFFGGNKIRKLEFLLSDALSHSDGVMTFGCAGSNHAVATAVHARIFNLECALVLLPQKNSHTVHRNLLLDKAADATMLLAQNRNERIEKALEYFFNYKEKDLSYPYIIPTGGSCPLGVLGYVNAAFELKKQIQEGLLSEPDYIYLPIGSGGTTAGLLLGCKAAGLQSKIIAISVVPNQNEAFAKKVATLFKEANELLHTAGNNFPLLEYNEDDCIIRSGFEGACYAVFTKEGQEAKQKFQELFNITLDGVYSAKASAALIADMQSGLLQDKKVLFWHTFCGDECKEQIDTVSYKDLPQEFHNYFERPVQELDC